MSQFGPLMPVEPDDVNEFERPTPAIAGGFANLRQQVRDANANRTDQADPRAFKRPPSLNNVYDRPEASREGGGSGSTIEAYSPDLLARMGQIVQTGKRLAPEIFDQPNGGSLAVTLAEQPGDPIVNLMAMLEANGALGEQATIDHIVKVWEDEGKDAATKAIENVPEQMREKVARAVLKERGWDGWGGSGRPLGSLIPDAVSDVAADVTGEALGAAAGAVSFVGRETGLTPAVGATLEGFAAMGRAATQVYRTGVELAASSPDELSWDGIVDELGDSWTEAGRGQEYVSPDRRQTILQMVGGDERAYEYLNKRAAGKDFATAAEEAGYHGDQIEQIVAELEDPAEAGFQAEAVMDEFRQSRRSFGRDLVRTGMLAADAVGLGDHDIYGTDMSRGWAKYVSGIGDGVWAITMDPAILAGGAVKATRSGYMAMLGVRSADDSFRLAARVANEADRATLSMAQIRHGEAVRAATAQLAEAIRLGDTAPIRHNEGLFSAWRELVGVDQYRLSNKAPRLGDTDELLRYLTDDGQALVARTMLGGRNTARRTVAPKWGAKEQTWYKAKTGLHKAVDLAKMPEVDRRLILAGDEITRAQRMQAHLVAPVTKALHAPSQAFTFLTSHAPRKAGVLVIDLPQDAAASAWDQMTDEAVRFFSIGRAFGMDEEVITGYRNTFLVGQNIGHNGDLVVNGAIRRETVRAFMDDLFDHMGLTEAHPVVQKFLSLDGHQYLADAASTGRKRAFLPKNQTSTLMAVPSTRDLFRAATHYSHTRQALNLANPQWLETALNRVWKPSVLLRAGFITRAAGEELIAYLAQFGPKQYLGAQLARGHVAHQLFDESSFGRYAQGADRASLVDGVRRLTSMDVDDFGAWVGRPGKPRPGTILGREFITQGTSRLWAPIQGVTHMLHQGVLAFTHQLDDVTMAKIASGEMKGPWAGRLAGLAKELDDQVLATALRGRYGRGVGAALNPLRLPSWMNKGYVSLVASDEREFVANTFLRYVQRKVGADATGRITQKSLAEKLAGYTDDDFAALADVLTDPVVRRAMAEDVGVNSLANQALEGEDVGNYAYQAVGYGRDGRPMYRKVNLVERKADQVVVDNPLRSAHLKDQAEFRRHLYNRSAEIRRDPFVGPHLRHLLAHVDDSMETTLARLAYEGEDAVAAGNRLRQTLHQMDSRIGRRFEGARLLVGGQTPRQYIDDMKALIDLEEPGALQKLAALTALDDAYQAGDDRLVALLTSGPDELTRDLDEVLGRIKEGLRTEARRSSNQRLLTGSDAWAEGMVRPLDEDFIPVYGLVIRPDDSSAVWARLTDDPGLQRGIVDDLTARHPDVDPATFEDLVARILDDENDLAGLHQTISRLGEDRAPLTRWLTTDDRVGRSVQEVLQERLGVYVGMGRNQVHRLDWVNELDGPVLHLGDEGVDSLAHYSDEAHIAGMEIIPPGQEKVLLTVDDLDGTLRSRWFEGREGLAGQRIWDPQISGSLDEIAAAAPPVDPGYTRFYGRRLTDDQSAIAWTADTIPQADEVYVLDLLDAEVTQGRRVVKRDWDTGEVYDDYHLFDDIEDLEPQVLARRQPGDDVWESVPAVVDGDLAGMTGLRWEMEDHLDGMARIVAGEDAPEAAAFLRATLGADDADTARRARLWWDLAGPERPLRELTEAEYRLLVDEVGEDLAIVARRRTVGTSPTEPEAFEGVINDALTQIETLLTARHSAAATDRVLSEAVGPLMYRQNGDLGEDIFGKIDVDELPTQVYGPRLADPAESTWDQLVRVGFDAVSASISSIIRKPRFLQEYVQARKAVAPHFARATEKLEAQRSEVDGILSARWESYVRRGPDGEDELVEALWSPDSLDEFIAAKRSGRIDVPWPHPVANLDDGSAEAMAIFDDLAATPEDLADIGLQLRWGGLPSPHDDLETANRMLQIFYEVPDIPVRDAIVEELRRYWNIAKGATPKHQLNTFRKAVRDGHLDGWVQAIDAGSLDVSDIIPHDRLRAAAAWAKKPVKSRGANPLNDVKFDQLDRLSTRLDEWIDGAGEPFKQQRISEIASHIRAERKAGRMTNPADLTREEMLKFHRYVNSRIAHEDAVRDVTVSRAMQGVIPYIDDHRIRSQFQEYVGNLIPFWFAEEQFLKRWARIIVQSPEVIRYGQLTMQAARTSGVIRKDAYGEEVFVFPGSSVFTQTLVGMADKVLPGDIVQPLASPLTASTSYLLPGFGDQTGTPSFGPLVGVGLEFLSKVNPELGYRLAQDLRTDETGTRDYLDFLLPAHFQRARDTIEAFAGGENEALAAATISTMARLAANGHGLSAEASPEEMQTYLDRVANQSRIEMALRTVTGWAGPTTPQFGYEEMWTDELNQLLDAGLPYEEAVTLYLRRHPDATMTTISRTVSSTGAPLSADEAALDELFALAESPLAQRYPDAAAWLILPQRGPDDEFSSQVFHAQLRAGLRERRSPEEFLRASVFQQVADRYFTQSDDFEAQIEAARAMDLDVEVRRLKLEQATWREGFRARHPVFTEELMSSAGRVRRESILRQAANMLEDPDFLEAYPEQAAAAAELVSLTESYRGARWGLGQSGTKASKQARAALDDDFQDRVRSVLSRTPDLSTFYDRVIRPQLQLDDLEVAA